MSTYSNNLKCVRTQSKSGADADTNTGSTVGGDFGFGYATISVNSANQVGGQSGVVTPNTGGGSSSGGGTTTTPTITTYPPQQFRVLLHDKSNEFAEGPVTYNIDRNLIDSETVLEDFVVPMLFAVFIFFMIIYMQLKSLYKNRKNRGRADELMQQEMRPRH